MYMIGGVPCIGNDSKSAGTRHLLARQCSTAYPRHAGHVVLQSSHSTLQAPLKEPTDMGSSTGKILDEEHSGRP